MFIGEYQHNLDAKGRIVIPGKFRDELHTSFILARGLDGCLTIYSLKQWEKLFEEVNKLPTTKKAARQYIRMLTSTASECTLDNQGRIQIPSFLAKPAGLFSSRETVSGSVSERGRTENCTDDFKEPHLLLP